MRRHKFGAVATVVDGHKFPSKAEAKRYQELRLLERAGRIEDIRVQVRYTLMCGDKEIRLKSQRYPAGRRAAYVADFVYRDVASGKDIIEDVKGYRLDTYRLKAAIMEAMGYRVVEVSAR